MQLVYVLLEAVMIASALSIDAFVASFAYGSNKIKIPMKSVQIINLICTGITGISLLIGGLLRQYIPQWATVVICFLILFTLGVVKLLDGVTKSIIRKHNHLQKEFRFKLFNFRFILNLYANPIDADVDTSKEISPLEAASLSIALSLDGIAVGFGAAMGNINGWAVVLSSLVITTAAILLGCRLGNRIARKTGFNLSWLSGLVLIVMAFLKLL